MHVSVPPATARVGVGAGVTLAVRRFDPPVRGPADDGRDLAPFLLVHGLASNARLWDAVGSRLAATGHVAVAVDLRSHGASDASDVLDHGTLVDDLATVADAAGLDRPVAVGQSWGGNVVLELGVRRPQVVRAVVGVDGGLIDLAARYPDAAACWAALAPPSFEGLTRAAIAARLAARCAGWPDGAAAAQLANFAADDDPDAPARPVLTRERHRRIVEHLFAHRPLTRLGALRVPMLVIDVPSPHRAVIDPEVLAAAAAAGAALDVVRLPGRDHDVHLQEPDLVARLLRDWAVGAPVPAAA
jgi:pimeloyl-ACP methyl ester carboxylesterase